MGAISCHSLVSRVCLVVIDSSHLLTSHGLIAFSRVVIAFTFPHARHVSALLFFFVLSHVPLRGHVGSQWSHACFPYFIVAFIAVWPSVIVSNTEVCCSLFIVSGTDCVHTRHLRYLVHVQ